ncbi:MAG: ATP-binding cassette domain-containing protein [Myxococcota bacterium]
MTDLEMRFARSGEEPLLRIPEWRVPSAAKLCITGASGTGKTTLLHLLAGLLSPTRGTVRIGDVGLGALREGERDAFRARHIGLVFQTARLLPGLSALENVALAASLGGMKRASAQARARHLLERVEVAGRADALPAELSVGEAQRVALARALATGPGLLLADEPTASLDPRRRDAMLALLDEVADENGSTLILVSHAPEVQAAFRRVVRLEDLAKAPEKRGAA